MPPSLRDPFNAGARPLIGGPRAIIQPAPAAPKQQPWIPLRPSGGSGGGGGGGGTARVAAAPPPDPYAEAKGIYRSQLPGAMNNIRTNASVGFDSARRNLEGNAQGLVNKISTGQKAITRGRENVELNRLNGIRDILGFVRRGLQQGVSRLSGMNSLDSSAFEAIGRAYNDIGADKARGIGNEAALQNRDIDVEQEDLNLQRNQGVTDFHRIKDEQVSSIGNQARQQFEELNQKARAIMLGDQVNVAGEQANVVNPGAARLNEVANWMNAALNGIVPATADQIKAAAIQLQAAGTAGTNPFNVDYDSQEVSGRKQSNLPIFVKSKVKE